MRKFLKKKKIPDELPELPENFSEKIEEKEEDKEIIKNHFNSEENPKRKNKEIVSEEKIKETSSQKKLEIKESFFDELQDNLLKEVDDLTKLEKWYKNKFLPGDVANEMRGYWENKKTDSIIKILGKNFQEKISGKISSLQNLEKEWQEIYFRLIEKEEKIKDKERELKKLLNEFIELCKKRKEKK